jgi:O-antigen/teichoic acid export membrane protein
MDHKQTKPSYRPTFAIDSFLNFSTQILLFGLSCTSSIIIARTLGPQGKGLYSLAILIPTLVASALNMGINNSNTYFISKRTFPISTIVANAVIYSFCIGSSATIITFFLILILSNYFLKISFASYLYITIIIIPFLLTLDNMNYIFLGCRKILKLSALRLTRSSIYVFLLLTFYIFQNISVYNVIFANIFGLFSATFLGSYFLVKDNYLTSLSADTQVFKKTLKFGIKMHLGAMFQLLNYRIDMLIIAALLTQSDLGLYSISVLIAETIWYLPNSIAQVLYAKVASQETESANQFTPLVCRSVALIIFLACLILYAFSDRIIPWLFTSKFLRSVMALKLLLPGILFLSISKILTNDLSGRGFPQYGMIASAVSLIFTIIFDLLLIPRFGINGASMASSLAYIIHCVIILHIFKQVSNVSFYDLFVWNRYDFVEYMRLMKSLKLFV